MIRPGQDRGDLRPAWPASQRPGQRRRGLPGAGHGVPQQVHAPPRKPPKDAPAQALALYEQLRHRQSSQRIRVEHAIAEHKQWRSLQRWIGRRDYYGETYLAVAGLVSDRAASGEVDRPAKPARPDPNRESCTK